MAKTKENNKEKLIKEEEYMIRWVDTYFNTNFNGRMTSKFLKPHLSLDSCEVDAARMLGKDRVKELIAIKREQIRIQENVELSWVIKELQNIVFDVNQEDIERDDNGRITSKPDRRSKIEAIKTIAKICGFEAPNKLDVTTNGESLNLKDLIDFKSTKNNE